MLDIFINCTILKLTISFSSDDSLDSFDSSDSSESSFAVVVVVVIVVLSGVVETASGSVTDCLVSVILSSIISYFGDVSLEVEVSIGEGDVVSKVSGSNDAFSEAVVSSSCLTKTGTVTSSLGGWNGFVLRVGIVAVSVEDSLAGASGDGASR